MQSSYPWKMTATQNEDDGYYDIVCIQCQNAYGSTIHHDNWSVKQLANCAAALKGTSTPFANKDVLYVDSADLLEVASSYSDFFTNPHSSLCGAITGCSLHD